MTLKHSTRLDQWWLAADSITEMYVCHRLCLQQIVWTPL